MGEVVKFPPKHRKGQLVVVTWLDTCEEPYADSAAAVCIAPTMTSGFLLEVDATQVKLATSAITDVSGATTPHGAIAIPAATIVEIKGFDLEVKL